MMVIATSKIYLDLQARWVKDLSVITNLAELPPGDVCKVDILDIEDTYRVTKESYRIYEYSGMLKLAWHKEEVLGISKSEKLKLDRIGGIPFKRYLLSGFKSPQCRGTLTISSADPMQSNATLALQYLQLRLFNQSELQAFLRSVTKIKLTEVAPIKPSN